MSQPVLVLVHGANHQAVCWELTVDVLRRRVPDGRIVAVDLPGRGATTIDPRTLSIDTCADAVIHEIDAAGADQVVLVGHSLGGVITAGVATKLGPRRVSHLVFIAATIPAEGGAVLDTLGGLARWTVPLAARRRKLSKYPRGAAGRAFCNGMSADQRAFVLDNLCPDASWLVTEPVSRRGLSPDIPRTWVLTTDDKAVSPEQQRRNISNLGGADNVIEIHSCHDVMVSEPAALAEAITSCWVTPATNE